MILRYFLIFLFLFITLPTYSKESKFENSETLSFLNNINKIQIINYTNFECKGKFGSNAHNHPVYPKEDNCFAKWEAKNNYIINYLESIF